MTHVFISYARSDHNFVQILVERLVQADIDIWLDSTSLTAGTDWRAEIENAIKASSAVVVVLSPAASQSQYVTYEWSLAIGMGIPVVPLLLERADIHPRLSTLQYFDFTARFDEPWQQLITAIRQRTSLETDVPDETTLASQEPYEVFLSYSRNDVDMMIRVRDDLRSSGFKVWTDEDLEPGSPSWQKSIETAIEIVKALVVLLSPHAKQSVWVEREVTYARAQKCPIIPVLIDGNEGNAVPLSLINAQRLDLVTKGYLPEINKLVSAIQAELKR